MIADEIIHARRKDDLSGVMLKLDIEKAYDHVKWDFVDYLFWRMGFDPKWRGWLRSCVQGPQNHRWNHLPSDFQSRVYSWQGPRTYCS